MMRFLLIFIAIVSAFSANCQTYLQDGDRCFDNGDYTCAETKFNEAYKLARGKDKQIVEIKLTRTKWCASHTNTADKELNNRNYRIAIENYQSVLESNPKDIYAKNQIEKCKNILNPPVITLNVSKDNFSFPSSGGNDSITVSTNAESYSVDVLPYWCSVQKYSRYFILSCVENSSNTSRTDYLTVLAGNKAVRVNVSQLNESKPKKGSLKVTKENLVFNSPGGNSEAITVYSSTGSYSIALVPSWCTVEQFRDYFFVSCKASKRKKTRSNWFKVSDGYNELKIHVSQAGK